MTQRTTCPTCGGPVVIASGDEGTNHYVPANTRQATEAIALAEMLWNALGEDGVIARFGAEGYARFKAALDG